MTGPNRRLGNGMHVISIKLPASYLSALDDLVKAGVYPSRSEAIRDAIRKLLEEKVWGMGWASREVKKSRRYFVDVENLESGDYQ